MVVIFLVRRAKRAAKRKLPPLSSYPKSQRTTVKKFRAMSFAQKKKVLLASGYPKELL
jgi:hypothetical protein